MVELSYLDTDITSVGGWGKPAARTAVDVLNRRCRETAPETRRTGSKSR